MKKLFLVIGLALGTSFLTQTNVQAQWCPNLNFSMGNFNYWKGYTGTWDSSGNVLWDNNPISQNRITIKGSPIWAGELFDKHCLIIPTAPSGFVYAAKLGNDSAGAKVQALEYTMRVDSFNSLLVVHFAWVMQQDTVHSLNQRPQFNMSIRDSLGRPINISCGNITFTADTNLSNLACNGSILAQNWTTVGFSLETLIGQTIRIYFETRDCSQGTHFGYAYIVAECRPMRIDLSYCKGMATGRLYAPDGFEKYTWTRSSDTNWTFPGNGTKNARLIVLQNPQDKEIITCELTSVLGDSCSATVNVIIEGTLVNPDFSYNYDTCSRTVTFVDISTVINSKKYGILWEIMDTNKRVLAISRDSLFTYTFPEPDSTPVTYKIRLKAYAENGCEDTISQLITVYPAFLIDTIYSHFTTQQKLYCNNTNITFTNKTFADILPFFDSLGCNPNINLTSYWHWGDGTISTQHFLNGEEPVIEHKYNFSDKETKVVVTLVTVINGSNAMVAYTDTLTIVRPMATAHFTDDGNLFPCPRSEGITVNFTDSSQGEVVYYSWNFGDTASGSDNTAEGVSMIEISHTYKKAGKYDVLLVVTDSNNCTDTKRGYVHILGTKGTFTHEEGGGCSPLSIDFYPSVDRDPDYIPDSLWVVTGDGKILTNRGPGANSLERTINHDYKTGGVYLPTYYLFKTVLFEGNKELCMVQILDQDTIYVIDLQPNFDTDPLYLSDVPVTFNNTTTWIPSYLLYDSIAWEFGNGEFSNDYHGTSTYAMGRYPVMLTMKVMNCVRTQIIPIKVVDELGIVETHCNASLRIYPNPTNGQLTIDNGELTIENVEVYNIVGQKLQSKIVNLQSKIEIDVSHLASGLYFLKVDNKTFKIIKNQ